MEGGLSIVVAADVDPTNVIGGAERMLYGQLKELACRGHRITVLTRGQDGRSPDETAAEGYRVIRYPMPTGTGASALVGAMNSVRKAVDRHIAAEGADRLYIQQPLAGAGALLSLRARRLPVIYQFHSPWSDEFRLRLPRAAEMNGDRQSMRLRPPELVKLALRKRLEGRTLRRVDRILVLSSYMRDRCREMHGLPRSKFAIVPGGVDTDHFRELQDPAREEFRARICVGRDEMLLLTVRNLEPRMGLGNLISAMRPILRAQPKAVCIIGGSGALEPALKSQAAALDLGDRLRFAGFIPENELPAYYASSDLFVLPTTALEGFGMVTVEALACGTPVVGTPVGATPEILNGLDVELVLAGVEPEDIASGVLKQLALVGQDSGLRLRARCRHYAVNHYGWPAVVDEIEAHLRGIGSLPRRDGCSRL